MKKEQNFDFRKWSCQMHHRIAGWKQLSPEKGEFVLRDGLMIAVNGGGEVAHVAAKDFKAYLKTAFGISARLTEGKGDITLSPDPSLHGYMERRVSVGKTGVEIAAADERGMAQALYSLEDRMNVRRAPFLECGTLTQKPAFSPRMVHSALGMDLFPNEYLSACAHHGFDAVLVFTRDAETAGLKGVPYDFDDLTRRAARYGIDVYAYSYIKTYAHPDDADAKEIYDRAYGDVFRRHPGLKGMVFVGESVNFPSKDPHVYSYTQKDHEQTPDGIPTGRIASGWWPCLDYAEWIAAVRDSIRAARPDADVVFWTYNWGKQPEEHRLALIDRLPTDISLLATFEMFDRLDLGNSAGAVQDYSVAHIGPGRYFVSEAAAAKRRGIRLYSMTNTAGRTWDFGVAPYEPFPWQWHRRHEAVLECREKYGLCGLMESHHYGFFPSFISLEAKEAFTIGGRDFDTYLRDWAHIVAPGAEQTLLDGMRKVDESIRCVVPSNGNQYGPYRIGPAYPFCLLRELKKPNTPDMMFGNAIYRVFHNFTDLTKLVDPYQLRVTDELRLARQALRRCREGLAILRRIPRKNAELRRLIGLVDFMALTHQTAVNFKQFHLLRSKLYACTAREEQYRLADRIGQIARREIKNAEAAIPVVRRDSSLGYEPSMQYQCDEASLRWKIKQVNYMLEHELPTYQRGRAHLFEEAKGLRDWA